MSCIFYCYSFPLLTSILSKILHAAYGRPYLTRLPSSFQREVYATPPGNAIPFNSFALFALNFSLACALACVCIPQN